MIIKKVFPKFIVWIKEKNESKLYLMRDQTNLFSIRITGCLQILRTGTVTKIKNTRYVSYKVLETCSKDILLGQWTKVHSHCVIGLTPAFHKVMAMPKAGVIESTTLFWASAHICELFTSIRKES